MHATNAYDVTESTRVFATVYGVPAIDLPCSAAESAGLQVAPSKACHPKLVGFFSVSKLVAGGGTIYGHIVLSMRGLWDGSCNHYLIWLAHDMTGTISKSGSLSLAPSSVDSTKLAQTPEEDVSQLEA